MTDTSDAALDALVKRLNDKCEREFSYDRDADEAADAITALRAKVAQLEMAAKSSGKVIVDMAGLPTPSAEFMAAMMPAFEAIAVQEMQKQVDALEAECDAALARESAAYARGRQAAANLLDSMRRDPQYAGEGCDPIIAAILALADAPPAPDVVEIDLRAVMMEEIENAAALSPWVPPEYSMNEIVSDLCTFLLNDRTPPAPVVEVKPLVFDERRNNMWEAAFGYEIGYNGNDEWYRVKHHGRSICKKIGGFHRAVEWANSHHTARIRAALLPQAKGGDV